MNNDTKHTPGPWIILPLKEEKFYSTKVLIGEDEIEVYCTGSFIQERWLRPSEREIARGWVEDYGMDHVETEEGLANARLIAAAPDLLEALRKIVQAIDGYGCISEKSDYDLEARAAIAKATKGDL